MAKTADSGAIDVLARYYESKPGRRVTADLIRDNIVDGIIPTREALEVIGQLDRANKQLHDHGTAMYAELEALRKRCEAVEADAERYRWLRDNCKKEAISVKPVAGLHSLFLDFEADGWDLDAAIDQAIAAAQEPSHG